MSTADDSLYQGIHRCQFHLSLVGLPCWLFILKIIFVKVCFNISKLGLLSIKDECGTQYCCKIFNFNGKPLPICKISNSWILRVGTAELT